LTELKLNTISFYFPTEKRKAVTFQPLPRLTILKRFTHTEKWTESPSPD